MGPVETDKSLDDAMIEATSLKMPCALRRLFAMIIVYCDISRDYYRELTEEEKIGFHEDDLTIIDMLNEEQSDGFDQIFDHVVCGRGHVFFVDGLEALVRSMDLIAIATTTSSIATSIMPGGRTAHSRFKIPIELGDNCVCNFTKQSGTTALLHATSLIIWDEVAMTLRQAVKTLDRSLIGNGTEETYINDYVLLPEDIVIEYSSDKSLDKFIECVFPNLKENYTSPSYMREHAILSTRNEHVDGLNARMIDMFPGKEKVYFSHDSVDDDTNNNYPLYFLNSITPNGLPLHELKVKKNCPVILNLDPHNGLCNGTRLVVRSFEDNTIDAEIVNGQHDGNRVFISRIPLYLSEDITLPFKFKRKQFPVRLSFAMTINKSQG
ncbi:hypothetical protein SETIT_6G067300v2 [Setaria italica]|uniref:ATP-dependent DNA helicase n=1 Tax=Setaria italica TaxID=4555 RepID=A0A368RIZ1_SETIT|nr:hypothetical protein SETIT_6G067300v2 [Setaria italica]